MSFVNSMRLMRALDARWGANQMLDLVRKSWEQDMLLLNRLMSDDKLELSPETRFFILRETTEHVVQYADDMHAKVEHEIAYFIRLFSMMNMPVHEEKELLKQLRESSEKVMQDSRRKEAMVKNKEVDRMDVAEVNAVIKRGEELMAENIRYSSELWSRIQLRAKDVLTILAQTRAPNSKELVDLFTGDPIP